MNNVSQLSTNEKELQAFQNNAKISNSIIVLNSLVENLQAQVTLKVQLEPYFTSLMMNHLLRYMQNMADDLVKLMELDEIRSKENSNLDREVEESINHALN